MSNWKHEEITGIQQAVQSFADHLYSEPRVPGKCQALLTASTRAPLTEREYRFECMECGFKCEGLGPAVVADWNAHIIYR